MRAALLVAVGSLAVLAAAWSLLAFALDDPGAQDLITNGGFEDGTTGWSVLGATLTAGQDPLDVDQAGALTLTSSTAFLLQPVAVIPGGSYRFSGQFVARSGGGSTASVWPKLFARDEHDGELGPFAYPTSLQVPQAWTFELVLPCDTATAQVRVDVSGNPGDVVYLDDLRLKAEAPVTPCPTPTPTPSDTPTASETPTRTPTSTPTATRTPTETRAPTPTPTTAAAVPSATETPEPSATPMPTPRDLLNGGFEVGAAGIPSAWRTFGGLLSQGSPAHSGLVAGCFASSTDSTKWVYQMVTATPGAWYELAAYIYSNDANVDAAWLRVSWYASDDGSGGALATADSMEILATPDAAYHLLTTGAAQVPAAASSASARIMLRPRAAAPASICIDDVMFISLAPPPPATASDTPTHTPTRRPTSTRTSAPPPTATRTASVPPASTSTRTPTSPSTPRATARSSPPTSRTSTPLPATATSSPVALPLSGLLVNGGFEVWDAYTAPGWRTYGGALAQASAPLHDGRFAAGFSSGSTSTKWLYQTVAVEPDRWYAVAAYVFSEDANVDASWLRVSWYASDDGSGSALDGANSTETLNTPEVTYRLLSTGPVQAPPDAHSARARIMLRPRSAAQAIVYVDDVSFEAAEPAPQLEPTEPAAQVVTGGAGTASHSSATPRPSSGVLGLSQQPKDLAPQPTPVIRRSQAVSNAETSGTVDLPAWAWVLVGSAAVAALAGGGTWWWERRAVLRGLA